MKVEPGFAEIPHPEIPVDRETLREATPPVGTFPNHDGSEL